MAMEAGETHPGLSHGVKGNRHAGQPGMSFGCPACTDPTEG